MVMSCRELGWTDCCTSCHEDYYDGYDVCQVRIPETGKWHLVCCAFERGDEPAGKLAPNTSALNDRL